MTYVLEVLERNRVIFELKGGIDMREFLQSMGRILHDINPDYKCEMYDVGSEPILVWQYPRE